MTGDSILPDETVYRRCLPGWYSPKKNRPSWADFMPRAWESEDHPGDSDGLSITRARITKLRDAAICPGSGKSLHVAEITVGELNGLDLSVNARPMDHDPGHAVIPEMNSLARRDPERESWMKSVALQLRNLVRMAYIADA